MTLKTVPVKYLDEFLSPSDRFTPLASLAPVGMGTSDVEALSSLVSRIARSHYLPIKAMMEGIVNYCPAKTTTWHMNMNGAYLVDRGGVYTDQLLPAMECLTGRDDLNRTTYYALINILSPRSHSLLTKHLRWCPHCLIEDDKKKQPRYIRLWWVNNQATVCPVHSVMLATTCSSCGKEQSVFGANGGFTTCSSCGATLTDVQVIPCSEQSLERDFWITKSVRQLVGDIASGRLTILKPDVLARGIQSVIDKVCDGEYGAFSRILGWQGARHGLWARGITKPTLSSLMELCYRLDIPLSNLLNRTGNMPNVIESRCHYRPRLVRGKKRPVLDKKILMRRINVMLESGKADSVRQWTQKGMALELGVTLSYLKYHFPEVCKTLEIDRKESQKAKRGRCIADRRLRAQKAIKYLKRKNIYPSDRNILNYGLLAFRELRTQEVKELLAKARIGK